MGVNECDNMLMLLSIPQKMTEKERDVVIPLMIRGFKVSVLDFLECLYELYCPEHCCFVKFSVACSSGFKWS